MTRLYYSPEFNQTARRIQAARPDVAANLSAAIQYLLEHGRDAVAPDIKWNLQTSAYRRNSGEIRWPDPEQQANYPHDAWRGLFIAATNTSWIYLTILGNKATGPHTGNHWYEAAIPLHDQLASNFITDHQPANPPTKNP